MPVKVLHVVLLILMNGLTSSLPLDAETRQRRAADPCKDKMCPAGTFKRDCSCSNCTANTFTDKSNREDSCHQCFMDCRLELHLQVVSPCSKEADVVCKCVDGYVCSKKDAITGHCTKCIQQPPAHTIFQPPVTVFQTTSQTVTLQSSTWRTNMVSSPAIRIQSTQGTVMELFILLLALCIVFGIITFCFYKQRKMDCLKKRLKKCSVRKQKEDNKGISSEIHKPIKQLHAQETHTQSPCTTNTDCPTSQAASREQPLPASGNLGPLHIYGAGTVFVSLLNQFGLNGRDKDEKDHREQPSNNCEMHSPPSPTIPLSTEERDISYISSPFQEQGKECHMSKEEGL